MLLNIRCDLLSDFSLTILSTTIERMINFAYSCDLLSDFSLTILSTTKTVQEAQALQLWFAFRFFFDNIINNNKYYLYRFGVVVICFQIFLWQYYQQLKTKFIVIPICCDLLSDFSLTILSTTYPQICHWNIKT